MCALNLKLFLFAFAFSSGIIVHGQTRTLKFDFGPGNCAQGYIPIRPESKYSDAIGYGLDLGSDVTGVDRTGSKPLTDDFITSDQPFYFSVKLPEGNYDIKVILGDKMGNSVTTIKAECRRLMVEKISTAKGKFSEQEFTVHLKDSIIRPWDKRVRLKSREVNYLHWDNKLTLEFNNTAPKVCAVEIMPSENIPTVFLAGNSTVVDQAEEPWAAWGQMIPAFFKGKKIAIANYAESGETLKAFKGERRLEKIFSMAKAGDYLFIEFAHNDQKAGGNHLDPFTTYMQTVKEWITEARRRGMIPVLVTSMNRRTFDSSGQITNSLGDYPEAMRRTGKQEGVAVIDLNAMSKVLYEAWGPQQSLKAFVHFPANSFPNQPNELKDDTHFTTYGAYELAKCVMKGIRENVPKLAAYLKDNLSPFDPAHPDPVSEWNLPMSAFAAAVARPDGN
jgi:lysophospholipase L1-like esterase